MQKIRETVEFLREKGMDAPELGIILGTGLGKLVEDIDVSVSLDYGDIPHFPEATVEFHSGKLLYGTLQGKQILAMQGRFHYYEGYDLQQVTFPVRVMKMLGVEKLLISNAGGAMNLEIKKGSLMVIDDHIDHLPDNPLTGPNLDELGPRYVDMARPYDPDLNNKLKEVAREKAIELHEGVYVAVQGPNLETRAEYRYLRGIGADVVGMSTVPEVIVCNHMSLPCCAVTVITDECDPDDLQPVNIEEIIEMAGKAELKLIELFKGLLAKL